MEGPVNERKGTFKVVVYREDFCAVSFSDLRQHFGTILDEVLPRFKKVVIKKNGIPVAVLTTPEDNGYEFLTFTT